MHARGLFASMIAVTAGCTSAADPTSTGSADPAAPRGYRVEQLERAADGVPYFIGGSLGRAAAPIHTPADAPAALSAILPALAAALDIPAAELVATRVERDALGMTHVRLAQQKHGLRVVGGDVVVHLGADDTVRSVNSTARDRDLAPAPSLTAARAAELAIAGTEGGVQAHQTELAYVISTGDSELYLAYEVLVSGATAELPVMDFVYVDAHTGRVVDRRPQVFTAKNRVIQNGNNGTFPVLGAAQIGSENTPPTDPIGLAAYENTGKTYDCYKELFQRDSYNNAGAVLTSTVHVVFNAGGGATSGNNAVWFNSPIPQLIPSQMAYGDGDGTTFTPLARAFDVTAHELTHAVTSATANLTYQNESGALNEGMSDILAAVCEAWRDQAISADTWLVGEDIFTPNTANDALRYMANPTLDSSLYPPSLGGSRDYYPERYTGSEDSGGVHLNSGIPNLAFHLLVTGGTHPRGKTTVNVPGIGMEQAGKIFYRALTSGHFTANTNLAQARTGTETAANELYPGCTRRAVSAAWAAVGVGTAPPPDAAPPVTEITAPADGATVQPGFVINANATDDSCILKVEISIDGAIVKTLNEAPFSYTTDMGLAPGPHTIVVTTYDATSMTSDTATVTIAAGPGPGPGGSCTTDEQCGEGQVCGSDGTCRAESPGGGDGGADDPSGCGCATGSSGRGAAGSLALGLALAFALRRRRARV